MEDDPGSVVGDWGPDGLFSGGYRVTVPLEGALLQRVAGIDTYSMAKLLMLGRAHPDGARAGGRRGPEPEGSGRLLTMLLATGGAVPHHALRRLPRQHHRCSSC